MSEPEPIKFRDQIPEIPRVITQPGRAVGAPLSIGGSSRQSQPPQQGIANRVTSAPAPGRALPSPASSDDSSGMQRAVNAFRAFMPIVQRILPLLDGNIGTAVANLIAPRPHPQPAPPPKVDLAPLEQGLTQLQTQHLSLREQVVEQNTALKRVEDQLEMVREATDRNTLEQQELLEDLKAFSGKLKVVAVLGIFLLTVGLLLELAMFIHLRGVLP
ncbi:MAG: hypothetical protein WBA18_10820 [Terracidiphilus sp.]